ncbi:MAG: DUF1351 domain-containing protein [Lachnospiraceae bacterium]|nr:DUF1351 domain-containing protein [Lachnospiraceae bacterium]
MKDLMIISKSVPGTVSFENFDDVKAGLQAYVSETYRDVNYDRDGIEIAVSHQDELKKMRDVVTKKQKEIEKVYSAPYIEVEKMLKELVEIIDAPYKSAKAYVDKTYVIEKQQKIMKYARDKATSFGEMGERIVNSPAFYNERWNLKGSKDKAIQDEIDEIFKRAVDDIGVIQRIGGEQTNVILARYFETLSMDGLKSFVESISNGMIEDEINIESENNVKGYKILKITATEDQMANLMNQLELMNIEVEEIEDGMPKNMEELIVPDFDSFVAFDIETTGTNGAANGDGEAKITEIGAVKVVNGEVVDRFDQLANPGRSITPMISRITHITNEMVADKPPVDEVIKMFNEFVGDSILVGHNIKSSDLRYITKAANKAGVNFKGPFLDTYLLAKKYKEKMDWEKLNLGYLAGKYGFEHKEAHRAWSDAEVNAKIYFELKKLSE